MWVWASWGSLSQHSHLSGLPSQELVAKHLRAKQARRPGTVDCFAAWGRLSGKLPGTEGWQAAKGARGRDKPLHGGSGETAEAGALGGTARVVGVPSGPPWG